MEILHTRTWLLQLYIIHETKTDWEKSFKKNCGNDFETFQLRRRRNALILLGNTQSKK